MTLAQRFARRRHMEEGARAQQAVGLRGPRGSWALGVRVVVVPDLAAEISGWAGTIHDWELETSPHVLAAPAMVKVNSS